jgi:hypothetical protein
MTLKKRHAVALSLKARSPVIDTICNDFGVVSSLTSEMVGGITGFLGIDIAKKTDHPRTCPPVQGVSGTQSVAE